MFVRKRWALIQIKRCQVPRLLVAGESNDVPFLRPTPFQSYLLTKYNQGTDDAVYGQEVPAEQIKLFTSSKETKLSIVQGGTHYLNASSPDVVNPALLEMVSSYK